MHHNPPSSRAARCLAAVVLSAATGGAVSAAPAANPVAAANTALAVDLYRQLAGTPGNLFFSPYSLSRVLAMAAAGARGPTAQGMEAALHLEPPADRWATGFADLTAELRQAAGDNVALVTADSLWIQAQFPLREQYLQVVRNQFGAEAMPADFIHNAGVVRSAINGWVDAQTNGRITNLIAPGALTPATRVVLCDAIYFKAKWDHQFRPQDTHFAPFHLSAQSGVAVSTMHETSTFRSVDLSDVALLELPYLGQRFSMVIVLPKAVDGLPAVERQLTDAQLRVWLAQLDFARAVRVGVFLPRFTARQNLQLGATLQRLGMTRAFDPATADFSGMADGAGLYLSDVVHQAFVKVDEEGTEAAAASAVIMLAFGIEHTPEIRVDHPFLFLIRDNATDTILFLGRILDPR